MIKAKANMREVWKLNTDDNRKLLAHDPLGDIGGLNLAKSGDGLEVLCAVLSDNTLMGLNPESGEVLWTQYSEVFDSPTDVGKFHPFPHADQDGFLYVFDKYENVILEIDIGTGQIQRGIDAKRELSLVFPSGNNLFGKYDDEHLVGYDLKSGEQKWEVRIPEKLRILGTDDSGLFVSSRGTDGLIVLDPDTGVRAQSYDMDSTPTSLAFGEDTIYVTLWDKDGSIKSISKLSSNSNWISGKNVNDVTYDNNQLLLVTRDSQKVLALNATTGDEMWEYQKDADPTISAHDITDTYVAVGYRSGSLGFINRDSGELEDLFPLPNGKIDIIRGAKNDKVYAANAKEIAMYAP